MNPESRVVVDVDGSPAAQVALPWAVEEAGHVNASVLALSVCRLGAATDGVRHALCPVVVVPQEGARHDGPLMLRPETHAR